MHPRIAKRVAKRLAQYGDLHDHPNQARFDSSVPEDEERPPIKCRRCGAVIPRGGPGQDVDCPKCGQTHNCFGQQIDFPYGRGEDYAGERYEDDY